jgi:GntR family transcriptional repressor for pyruvate dehydrogenase complex
LISAKCWNLPWLRAPPRTLLPMKWLRWKTFSNVSRKSCRGETTIAEDAEFHYSIALASGNSVVLKVLDILMDLLRETRERSMQVEGRPEKSLAGHRRILAAIKRQDAESAKAAMRRHIEDVEEIVLDEF